MFKQTCGPVGEDPEESPHVNQRAKAPLYED